MEVHLKMEEAQGKLLTNNRLFKIIPVNYRYLRAAPVYLQFVIPVALVPLEPLGPLLDDLRPGSRGESHLTSAI